MKLIRFSALAILTLLTISCSDTREVTTFNEPSETEVIQQCLDSKMERWYKAFNRYQLEGYNMFAADLKALQEANVVYQDCQEQNLQNGNHAALN